MLEVLCLLTVRQSDGCVRGYEIRWKFVVSLSGRLSKFSDYIHLAKTRSLTQPQTVRKVYDNLLRPPT